MRKSTASRLALLLFVICVIAPRSGAGADGSGDPALREKRELFQKLKANAALPLAGRVQAIPEDFLDSLIAFDKSIGIRDTDYGARTLSTEEMTMFDEYVKLLPEKYRTAFSKKLLALYFVDNFAGAGFTDWLLGDDGDFYYYMILNSALLTETLDSWLTYRENSFFADDSPFFIKVRTGTDYKALLYGLLHEGGHIVDIEYHVTPYIDPLHRKVIGEKGETSDFTRGVWEAQKRPLAGHAFDNQDRLNVYNIFERELIPGGEMEVMFRQLSGTAFVSFYAGSAWYEDFADLMTYHHIEKNLGGSIRMELYDEKKLVRKISPARRERDRARKSLIKIYTKQ